MFTANSMNCLTEARGLGLGVGRRAGGQLGEDVVDVVLAVGLVGQQDRRRLHAHRIDHGREAKDRLQLGIGIDAPHGELGALAVRGGDAQVVERELEGPGLEADALHRDLAAQLLARDLLQLALGDRRHRQPGQDPEAQKHQQCNDSASHPFVLP